MSFEDELRATMRAHDDDAPTVIDTARLDPALVDTARLDMAKPDAAPQRRRTARWLPVAAAAAVVLAVGGLALALRPDGRSTATSRAGCPHRYERQQAGEHLPVPAAPTTTDPDARLVPQDTPSSVVVCAYLGDPVNDRQALTGTRRVTAGLADVPASLTFQPRRAGSDTCLQYRVPSDAFNFLVRLRYGSRTLWVTAPGDHCATASNGRFRSMNNLAAYAQAAYRTGTWPLSPPALARARENGDDEACTTTGRLGQDKKMVPGSPTGLTVCAIDSPGGASGGRITDTGRIQAFVSALNALPTRPSDSTFIPGAGNKYSYRLAFTYAAGPGVQIDVHPGARPPMDNRSLQATELGPVLGLLRNATR